MKKEPEVVMALGSEDLDCKVIREDVLGYTGEEYRGRKIIAVHRRPERFGSPKLARESVVLLTLHRGILNHMGMHEPPTPYWAVMDVMSDLKEGFTMEQVVSRAMAVLSESSGNPEIKLMEACRTAWYVLKSHQTHPKERYRGMSYMVEEDHSKNGKFIVRARRLDEMQGVFDKVREEKMAGRGKPGKRAKERVEKEPVVLATHVVQEVT